MSDLKLSSDEVSREGEAARLPPSRDEGMGSIPKSGSAGVSQSHPPARRVRIDSYSGQVRTALCACIKLVCQLLGNFFRDDACFDLSA